MAFKDPARSRAYKLAYQRAYRRRHAGEPRPPRRKTCLVCDQAVGPGGRTYCSNRCQFTAQYRAYIQRWLAGEVSGGSVAGVSDHVRRYLIERGGERCSRCGWSERHPVTSRVPLEIDHLDGNYANNSPLNVRLLCPNCHALTPTYRALNKGNGRPWAVVRRQA